MTLIDNQYSPYPTTVQMVSVIMTTWNRAHLIMESIHSVLRQTHTDLELLIADDGSEDDTEALISSITDSRIRYYKMAHTGRTGYMKNFLIGQTHGNFIAFNDSDDLWKEDKLEKQLRLFQNCPAIGFSITGVTNFRNGVFPAVQAGPLPSGEECLNIFDRMKANRLIVYNQTMMLKKSSLEIAGLFDENMPSGDFHFHIRMACHFDAGILHEPLVWRRLHDANISEQLAVENYEEYIAAFEYLYRHKMLPGKYLRKAKSHAYFSTGNLYLEQGRLAKARHNYLQSLRYNPFRPGCYWRLVRSF